MLCNIKKLLLIDKELKPTTNELSTKDKRANRIQVGKNTKPLSDPKNEINSKIRNTRNNTKYSKYQNGEFSTRTYQSSKIEIKMSRFQVLAQGNKPSFRSAKLQMGSKSSVNKANI